MSNIYIQEPPTSGKICLETTVGDIDIELWAKETPKAARNFIQLCMEGYYDGTIFHRLVKGFIVQGGDPRGDGTGGNSIWGKPFKDEFHSRLRFTRRGLVAMANSGRDDNGSQFFFTLAATPELQDKHTIFGKVAGNTIYNMIKLEESSVEGERPNHLHKILRAKILNNPFDDIVPRELIKKEKHKKEKRPEAVGTKNFKLLSFGEEAEEEEDEVNEITKQYSGKGKSSHDLTQDPKLASEKIKIEGQTAETAEVENEDYEADKLTVESVRAKLKRKESSAPTAPASKTSKKPKPDEPKIEDDDEDEGEYYLGKSEELEKKKKLEGIKREVKELKKEMKRSAVAAEEAKEAEKAKALAEDKLVQTKEEELASRNSMIKEYFETQKEYSTKKVTKKGESREQETLALLKKFKEKMNAAKETVVEDEAPSKPEVPGKEEGEAEEEDDDDASDISWLAKKFENKQDLPTLAKDANLKSDDWFEIYDPRNPINKRRRGEDMEKKSKSKGERW